MFYMVNTKSRIMKKLVNSFLGFEIPKHTSIPIDSKNTNH
ncbi:hypothetical protein J3D55_001564 [Chryseobacterium ginsenosidimutans]|nr:hypothetical protein [Chryseobacterium ginsenosidimutans]